MPAADADDCFEAVLADLDCAADLDSSASFFHLLMIYAASSLIYSTSFSSGKSDIFESELIVWEIFVAFN